MDAAQNPPSNVSSIAGPSTSAASGPAYSENHHYPSFQIPPQNPYAAPPLAPYAPPHAPPWGYYPHPNPYQYAPPLPPLYGLPSGQLHGIPLAVSANNSESPFPSPGKTGAKIPLDQFCDRYSISDADKSKLVLLEYTPGNKDVMDLEEADWKGANFSKLGWKAFLRAHRQFVKDIKDGSWAAL